MTDDIMGPMEKMLFEAEGDANLIGERCAAVLEFLTVRAVIDHPYVIATEDDKAMALFAAGDAVQEIKDALSGILIKTWDDPLDDDTVIPFETNRDPGDEQDEPTPESE
jgi:hypothetical protein